MQRAFGGLTALHFAAVTGCLEAVQALLRAGASIMVKSGGCWGRWRRDEMGPCPAGRDGTILALAATCSYPCIKRALCACTCCPAAADGEAYIGEDHLVPGSSPLHVAVIVQSVSIVHAILQVGGPGAAQVWAMPEIGGGRSFMWGLSRVRSKSTALAPVDVQA